MVRYSVGNTTERVFMRGMTNVDVEVAAADTQAALRAADPRIVVVRVTERLGTVRLTVWHTGRGDVLVGFDPNTGAGVRRRGDATVWMNVAGWMVLDGENSVRAHGGWALSVPVPFTDGVKADVALVVDQAAAVVVADQAAAVINEEKNGVTA